MIALYAFEWIAIAVLTGVLILLVHWLWRRWFPKPPPPEPEERLEEALNTVDESVRTIGSVKVEAEERAKTATEVAAAAAEAEKRFGKQEGEKE